MFVDANIIRSLSKPYCLYKCTINVLFVPLLFSRSLLYILISKGGNGHPCLTCLPICPGIEFSVHIVEQNNVVHSCYRFVRMTFRQVINFGSLFSSKYGNSNFFASVDSKTRHLIANFNHTYTTHFDCTVHSEQAVVYQLYFVMIQEATQYNKQVIYIPDIN